MSEFKEVWYVWDGVEIVENVPMLLERSGRVIENAEIDVPLGLDPYDRRNYSAYTLGQKRRRVECGNCCEGWFCYDDIHEAKCHACNGTGKAWEYAG